MALDDGTLNHQEILRQMKVEGSWDNWPRGKPEVYALYTFGEYDGGFRQDYAYVGDVKGKWYSFNNVIFHFDNRPGHMYWRIDVFDYDPGQDYSYNIDTNFAWKEKNYGIKFKYNITNKDDHIGSTLVYYYHTPTDTTNGWSEVRAGSAVLRLDYNEYKK